MVMEWVCVGKVNIANNTPFSVSSSFATSFRFTFALAFVTDTVSYHSAPAEETRRAFDEPGGFGAAVSGLALMRRRVLGHVPHRAHLSTDLVWARRVRGAHSGAWRPRKGVARHVGKAVDHCPPVCEAATKAYAD